MLTGYLAALYTNLMDVARAREKIVAKLVEGHTHDTIARVESLLHAVAVVHVNVDVEYSRVYSFFYYFIFKYFFLFYLKKSTREKKNTSRVQEWPG